MPGQQADLLLDEQRGFDVANFQPYLLPLDGWTSRQLIKVSLDLVSIQGELADSNGILAAARSETVGRLAVNRARLILATGLGEMSYLAIPEIPRLFTGIKDQLAVANRALAIYLSANRDQRLLQCSATHVHTVTIGLSDMFGINVRDAHQSWLDRQGKNHKKTIQVEE